MSLPRLLCTTCLTLTLAGTALAPASAMDTHAPPQAGGFTLQEPQARLKLRLVPGTTLATGYHSPFYEQNAATGAITLQTDALQPSIRGQTAPATVLREGTAWYSQQTPADMTATLHIDTWPSNQRVIIGQIQSAQGPIIQLIADGKRSQVIAVIHNGTETRRVVAGTIYPDRSISYGLSSRPNGTLLVVVNGTRNIFAMPAAATAPAMWFEAVAGQTGWHMPCHSDAARVTFTSLEMSHPAG